MSIAPKELREWADLQSYEEWHATRPKLLAAADEIARLKAENERLQAGRDAAIHILCDARLPLQSRVNDANSILARCGIDQKTATERS